MPRGTILQLSAPGWYRRHAIGLRLPQYPDIRRDHPAIVQHRPTLPARVPAHGTGVSVAPRDRCPEGRVLDSVLASWQTCCPDTAPTAVTPVVPA